MSRYGFIKRYVLALAIFGIVSLAASTARADIVVITGVNNQGTDNVLLNPATDENTVTGTVGQNNLLVNFTSTGGTLSADPSGQARVTPGSNNDPFEQLTFSLDGGATFTRAVFNINSGTDGAVLIHVEGVNIDGGFFEDDFVLDANGENFFTVTAINGQLITSISLEAIEGAVFEDVRQVRLGGGEIVETPIPEPATMLLLGTGLAGVAAGVRKRRGKK